VEPMASRHPVTGRVVWEGQAASRAQVKRAIAKAREASESWSVLEVSERIQLARKYAEVVESKADLLAKTISEETGKPRWEARQEADLVKAKVAVSIEAIEQRTSSRTLELPGGVGRTLYRPLGVAAVLGPFNFPAHLPNGHIVPALLAGNTVVFKPSEKSPATGALLAAMWEEAGLPRGVLQVVQGGRDTGQSLVEGDVDAVFFTGSHAAGKAIHRALAAGPRCCWRWRWVGITRWLCMVSKTWTALRS
ncbi:MAG: aldehyde dehydrogenase family protein, partial [Sphingopyxis sp.]|nr:aldehyde dehydrogenase family protein [Sphingopyxis sp.]